MGTLIVRKGKEGKNRYQARVRVKGGKQIAKTFDSKSRAKDWMVSTEAGIKEGRFNYIQEQERHTVSDMIDRYIETELIKKPKSYKKQKMQLEWWSEKIGHYTLAKIRPALIVECRDKLSIGITCRGGKRSPSTVNRYLAVLSHCFTVATREWQWVDDNPMRSVGKLKEARGRDNILEFEEMQVLLAACKASRNKNLFPIVRLALATGMRRGEISSLAWKDVDLQRSRIILRNTKNNEVRAVHLAPDINEMLKELYLARESHMNFLFPSQDGRKPADIRTSWEAALERANLKNFRFHDLRHTAASHMAMGGSSDAELRSFLGHRSATMVTRYAHYRESAMESSVNRLSEKITAIL